MPVAILLLLLGLLAGGVAAESGPQRSVSGPGSVPGINFISPDVQETRLYKYLHALQEENPSLPQENTHNGAETSGDELTHSLTHTEQTLSHAHTATHTNTGPALIHQSQTSGPWTTPTPAVTKLHSNSNTHVPLSTTHTHAENYVPTHTARHHHRPEVTMATAQQNSKVTTSLFMTRTHTHNNSSRTDTTKPTPAADYSSTDTVTRINQDLTEVTGSDWTQKSDSTSQSIRKDTHNQTIPPDSTNQTIKPDPTHQTITPDTTNQVLQSDSTKRTVRRDTTNQLIQSDLTDQTTRPDTTNKTIIPDTTHQIIQSDLTNQTTRPDTTNKTIIPDTTHQIIQSDLTNQTIKPDSTNQLIQSDLTNQTTRPDTTNQIIQSELTDQTMRPDTTNQTIQPDRTNRTVRSGMTNQTTRPDTTNKTIIPDTIYQIIQSDLTNQTIKPDSTKQLIQSDLTNQTTRPDTTNKTIIPDTTHQIIQSDFTNQTVRSGMTNQTTRPDTTNQTIQPDRTNRTVRSGMNNQTIRPDRKNQIIQSDLTNQTSLFATPSTNHSLTHITQPPHSIDMNIPSTHLQSTIKTHLNTPTTHNFSTSQTHKTPTHSRSTINTTGQPTGCTHNTHTTRLHSPQNKHAVNTHTESRTRNTKLRTHTHTLETQDTVSLTEPLPRSTVNSAPPTATPSIWGSVTSPSPGLSHSDPTHEGVTVDTTHYDHLHPNICTLCAGSPQTQTVRSPHCTDSTHTSVDQSEHSSMKSVPIHPVTHTAAVPSHPVTHTAAVPSHPVTHTAAVPSHPVTHTPAVPSHPVTHTAAVPSHPVTHTHAVPSHPVTHTATVPSHPIIHTAAVPSHPVTHTHAVPSHPVTHTAAVPSHPITHTAAVPSDPVTHTAAVPSHPVTHTAAVPSHPHTNTNTPTAQLIDTTQINTAPDWAQRGRVFVVEDQPVVVKEPTFQLLLQILMEPNCKVAEESTAWLEPFLHKVAGYESHHVTWSSGCALQVVAQFQTHAALSWLRGAESLLKEAGLSHKSLYVNGRRVQNITVGGPQVGVCGWLVGCEDGFDCLSAGTNATCRSRCHSGFCHNLGICVHRRGVQPACRCPVGDDFWYMGRRCDIRMTHHRLVAVCFGVVVTMATAMALLSYVVIRRFKTMLIQAKVDQTRSSYRRFNHFDELSARYWPRSWPGSADSLENPGFSRSDELLHLRALDRTCCYHDDTLSISSTWRGSAVQLNTIYPHSSQYRWDLSTCSLADVVGDSGKASDLSVCSWPIEPIQWTPFPLLQQLHTHRHTPVRPSRTRSYCEGMELVDLEKSWTA
ncbi:mucin-5AC-like isoform X3 [Denticeps clupeoides]|uniref:mucin-5AC-like isoform X3 n=1 Tax=Denticeps clupeoides TaxID=299321 RepID=UPI0010A4B82F|nr:mucin-5AC-like isoform X3 [Denticeps clupeoides]